MDTIKNFKQLRKTIAPEGTQVIVEDENLIYIYENGGWHAQKGTDFKMTLYDLNISAIAQRPAYNEEDKEKAIKVINDYVEKHNTFKYFALICKELSNKTFYCTILHRYDWENRTEAMNYSSLGETVINELALPPIHLVSDEEDKIEVWCEDGDSVSCYNLFPYDLGVVEVL